MVSFIHSLTLFNVEKTTVTNTNLHLQKKKILQVLIYIDKTEKDINNTNNNNINKVN